MGAYVGPGKDRGLKPNWDKGAQTRPKQKPPAGSPHGEVTVIRPDGTRGTVKPKPGKKPKYKPTGGGRKPNKKKLTADIGRSADFMSKLSTRPISVGFGG